MRAAIAPCIESVFLLDRLFYLHEQVTFLSNCLWLLLVIMKLMQATAPPLSQFFVFCRVTILLVSCGFLILWGPQDVILSLLLKLNNLLSPKEEEIVRECFQWQSREFQSVPRYTKALLTCHFDSLYSDTKFHSLQGQTYTCNK